MKILGHAYLIKVIPISKSGFITGYNRSDYYYHQPLS